MEILAYTDLSDATVMKTIISHDTQTGKPKVEYYPMTKDAAALSRERYSRMPKDSIFMAKTPEETDKVMAMAFSVENMASQSEDRNPHMEKPARGHYITERIYKDAEGNPEYVAVAALVHSDGTHIHMQSFGNDRDALYAHLHKAEQEQRFNVYAEHINDQQDPGYRIPPVTAGELCDHACVHAHAERMYQGKEYGGKTDTKAPAFMRVDQIKDAYRDVVSVTRGSKTMDDILHKDEPVTEVDREQESSRA